MIGPGEASSGELGLAFEVGRWVAEAGAVLVCGGLGGVMEEACRGAAEAGGTTVGLLPGSQRSGGNPYLTVAVVTGLGELRNGLVVRTSDALVAVGGSWGTLSEVALALRTGKTVVGLAAWALPEHHPNYQEATSPAEAVRRAIQSTERV